jgi:hypothetical protein
MTDDMDETTQPRISEESVREATGRGWGEWLDGLDPAREAMRTRWREAPERVSAAVSG